MRPLAALLALAVCALPARAEISYDAVKKSLQGLASSPSALDQRLKDEGKVGESPFGIELYRPNYVLPYYYTGAPYNDVYSNRVVSDTLPRRTEFAAQLSWKVPVWKDIFGSPTKLDFAYTQLMYWQVYTRSAYFRETDYEPEVFLSGKAYDWFICSGGLVHQSNGRGGIMERSWNRAYIAALFPIGDWTLSVKPWVPILQRDSSDLHNADIAHYMGYGELLLVYKERRIELSMLARNVLESAGSRGGLQLTASFPLKGRFRGYAVFFKGYGQSLIEYNHPTTSFGFGIALNDWI